VSDLKAATAALLREDHLRNGRPSSPTYDHHKKPAGPETPPEFQSSTNGEGRSQTDADPEKAQAINLKPAIEVHADVEGPHIVAESFDDIDRGRM